MGYVRVSTVEKVLWVLAMTLMITSLLVLSGCQTGNYIYAQPDPCRYEVMCRNRTAYLYDCTDYKNRHECELVETDAVNSCAGMSIVEECR